jgi:hypothetical protein
MACGAISDPFPVSTAKPLILCSHRNSLRVVGLSEKQYIKLELVWQDIVGFLPL